MKSIASISFLKIEDCYRNTRFFLQSRSVAFFSIGVLFFFHSTLNAQQCTISNNTITLAPATCAGTVALFQGTVPTGGSGTYTYQWEASLGNCGEGSFYPIPGATGKDYPVPENANGNSCYRRIVTSGACTDESNKIKIQPGEMASPAPLSTLVVQPTCATGTGTITVTSPAPAAGITYSVDGITYSNTTGVFTGLTPKTYSVTVKYASGCISPAKLVTVNALPALTGSISPNTASFCAGGSQVLTVTGGASYQWYRNGLSISGATSSTYTATQAGTYTADIINGSCKGTSSNSSTVSVTPLPTGSITPSSATICAGSSQVLTVTGGTSYQWYKDGVAINGATTATYTATQAGSYTADIINSAGCKAQSFRFHTIHR